MPKDTFYFTHDYNTRNDVKIKHLLQKYGMQGYGIFWAIVEDLYNNANALPLDYECIAFDLRVEKETVQSVIHDFGLFVIENNQFGSLSVQKRLEERNLKSLKAQQSAFKRWNRGSNNNDSNANALQRQSDSNAIKESKEKESKENGSVAQAPPPTPLVVKTDKRSQVVAAPTLAELEKYFSECTAGFWRPELAKQEANKLFNHYQETAKDGGWRQKSGNKIVDWKATANKWILNDNSVEFQIRSGKMERKTVIPAAVQTDDQISKECEYLYQRFLENQLNPETIQLQHYNALKSEINQTINEDIRIEIKKRAAGIMVKRYEGSNEAKILRLLELYQSEKWSEINDQDGTNFNTLCKRLALIEFFKLKQSTGALNLLAA